jgi:hypothetical protein
MFYGVTMFFQFVYSSGLNAIQIVAVYVLTWKKKALFIISPFVSFVPNIMIFYSSLNLTKTSPWLEIHTKI